MSKAEILVRKNNKSKEENKENEHPNTLVNVKPNDKMEHEGETIELTQEQADRLKVKYEKQKKKRSLQRETNFHRMAIRYCKNRQELEEYCKKENIPMPTLDQDFDYNKTLDSIETKEDYENVLKKDPNFKKLNVIIFIDTPNLSKI